jgi:hypothetical protein
LAKNPPTQPISQPVKAAQKTQACKQSPIHNASSFFEQNARVVDNWGEVRKIEAKNLHEFVEPSSRPLSPDRPIFVLFLVG